MKKRKYVWEWIYEEEDVSEKSDKLADNPESIFHKEISISVFWTKRDLNDLKELVSEWLIDEESLEWILRENWLNQQNIVEIIDAINTNKLVESIRKIENQKDLWDILPTKYRISLKEYNDALIDESKRLALLVKLEDIFDFLYYQTKWTDNKLPIRRFALFTRILHRKVAQKKLDKIHDIYIDVKNDLTA